MWGTGEQQYGSKNSRRKAETSRRTDFSFFPPPFFQPCSEKKPVSRKWAEGLLCGRASNMNKKKGGIVSAVSVPLFCSGDRWKLWDLYLLASIGTYDCTQCTCACTIFTHSGHCRHKHVYTHLRLSVSERRLILPPSYFKRIWGVDVFFCKLQPNQKKTKKRKTQLKLGHGLALFRAEP